MRELHRLRKILAGAAALLTVYAMAAPAFAQEFTKVPDRPVETIAANPFIAGAYGFIWVAVVVYVVYLARGLGKVNREIDDLRRKLGS